MALGLSFRGGSQKKSMSPMSRAQSRQSKNQNLGRVSAASRGSGSSSWQRGQKTLGQPKPSLFFGPPAVGGGKASAPAGALDILMGRGTYMKEFQKQRKEIVRDYLKEKRQEKNKWRRMESRLRTDLRRQDEDVYREYNISLGMRPKKGEAADSKQQRLAKRAQDKVMTRFRRNQRDALAGLQKSRDKRVTEMKKQLRDSHDTPLSTAA